MSQYFKHKKNTFKTHGIDRDEIIEGKTISLYCEWEWVDVGIGHYDFHGEQGFDSKMVCDIVNICWDIGQYTIEENQLIDVYVNDNYEELSSEFYEIIEREDDE